MACPSSGKQIHDAIDWVEAMSRMQSVQILKLLRRALKDSAGCVLSNLSPSALVDGVAISLHSLLTSIRRERSCAIRRSSAL